MSERLRILMELNPEFKEAVHRGETWAIQHADTVSALDGGRGQLTGRRHPERARKEDGKPHHFCNGCSDKEGCVSCDLDDLPESELWRWVHPQTGEVRYTKPKNAGQWEKKHRTRD